MLLPLRSLRLRLIAILLPSLIVVAALAITWRYDQALRTAERLYDKTLMAVTLAISRHVISSGGDLVAEDILELVTANLGDQVFYRVSGPDGSFVTGYASGPALPPTLTPLPGRPQFFDGEFQGEPVRAAVYRAFNEEGDLKGWYKVKVWQTTRERTAFARGLVLQTLSMLLALIGAAAAMIYFGINIGLKPLLNLEEAIALRSPDDLSPIRRTVPVEVKSLVTSVNSLFARLNETYAARNALIANAAHQLRNPIAAVLSQAESAAKATSPEDAHERILKVAIAARQTSRLTQQLLSLEKAGGTQGQEAFDLASLTAEIARKHAPEAIRRGARFDFSAPETGIKIVGNQTMVGEAIDNLIDNAVRYGLRDGGAIKIRLNERADNLAAITVEDDGPGIPEKRTRDVFERFVRLNEKTSDGCGLGLAIVSEVANAHGGNVKLENGETTKFVLSLPMAEAA